MANYDRFERSELILRDELALDRTLLANERTLLAYLRSGVALFIAGVSILQFASSSWWFRLLGIASLPVSVFVTIFGARRYLKMDRAISVLRNELVGDRARDHRSHGNKT